MIKYHHNDTVETHYGSDYDGSLVPVLIAAPLAAQTATDVPGQAPTTLTERIETRKAQLKIRLNNAQQLRLKARCTAAQKLLKVIDTRLTVTEKARSKAYENISQRLTALTDKIGSAADTSDLKQAISELNIKIDVFNTKLTAYHQVIKDLVDMKCSNDPTGFRASLEAAKDQRAEVISAASSIRDYVSETIKPILKDLKVELQASRTTGNE